MTQQGTLADGLERSHSRAVWLGRLLKAGIGADVIALLLGLERLSLLRRLQGGEDIAEQALVAADGRYAGIGSIQLLVFVATAIIWLMWTHRAYANQALIGCRKTRHSPGWAVGYWFIPFANLVEPYRGMAELWRRSQTQNAISSMHASTPALIGWWWGLYLLGNVIGRFVMAYSRNASDLVSLASATQVNMASDVLTIVTALLALKMITGIDAMQASWRGAPVPELAPTEAQDARYASA